MAQIIQFKRGLNANFEAVSLLPGEAAFVTDKGKFYVGDGSKKVLINPDIGSAAALEAGNAAGQVPIVGSDGKLDESIMPALTISDTFVVANEAEMLALNAQAGDVAIREDESKTYILQSSPATKANNWKELKTPTSPVQSVNGKTGAVMLNASDVGAEPVIAEKKSAFNVDFEDSASSIQMNGAASAGSSMNAAHADHIHPTDTSRASLESPAFTGSPTAPTAAAADSSAAIATTAFVKAQNYLSADSIIDGGTF